MVDELWREVADLKYSNTDQCLFDLAIAAASNGKADWLVNLVKEDRKSKFAWRRSRMVFLDRHQLPLVRIVLHDTGRPVDVYGELLVSRDLGSPCLTSRIAGPWRSGASVFHVHFSVPALPPLASQLVW